MNSLKVIILALVCYSFVNADNEERPAYNVVKSLSKNVEVREYLESKWVCTAATGGMFQDSTMFFRLFGYIQKEENDQKMKMPMTAPVLMWFEKTATGEKKVMCFYIPKQFHANTPNPSSVDVYLRSEPKTTTATIKFSGFASTRDYTKKKAELLAGLGSDAKSYNSEFMIMAGYDSPFKFFDRTNEVWLKKTN